MKAYNTFFLAAVATSVLTAASYKQESIENPSASKSLAFVGKNLVMTDFTVNPAIDLDGDGKQDADLMAFLRPCDKDNTLTFEENGNVAGTTGQLACSTDESIPYVTKPSHWTYNAQAHTIRIVKDNDPSNVTEWKVLEASASGLKVEKTATEYNHTHTTTMTFKAVAQQ